MHENESLLRKWSGGTELLAGNSGGKWRQRLQIYVVCVRAQVRGVIGRNASSHRTTLWRQHRIWILTFTYARAHPPHKLRTKVKIAKCFSSHSVWSSFHTLVTFCNIALMPLFSLLSTSIVTHPTPCTLASFSPLLFVVVFVLILPDVDLMLFITSSKTSSIKIWFVLAVGLAENLTQMVFR